ncbi:MAG: hypothetical protein KC800_32390 [Candidatus Eremiobacteraeota bacterium]|nr:hypothetical protein [Candidatus Eremiobacteraeota bacterium]
MDRERLEDLLTGLMDDELSAEEKTELEKELESSEEARNLLQSYRDQAESLKNLAPVRIEEDQKAAVLGKIKSAPIPLKPSARSNFLWFVGTIAACFIFFSASLALRPAKLPEGRKLYFSGGAIQDQPIAQLHQLVLKPGTDIRVLDSGQINGFLTEGSAVATLECDGGETAGQLLRLRLSLDLDGDKEFDVVQESETFHIDSAKGYEVVAARFPTIPEQYHDHALNGTARLELIGDSMSGDGLNLQFRPEQASLTLPVRSSEVM